MADELLNERISFLRTHSAPSSPLSTKRLRTPSPSAPFFLAPCPSSSSSSSSSSLSSLAAAFFFPFAFPLPFLPAAFFWVASS